MRLPRIISNNMVLQQGLKVPIWGKADPGEQVRIEFQGQVLNTKAVSDGNWKLFLAPLKPGGPYVMKISGKEKIELTNILVGEVWLASGQSNMEMRLIDMADGPETAQKAKNSMIRLFTVPQKYSFQPEEDIESGEWVECTPDSAKDFSAAAYVFAQQLQENLKMPVGIIGSYWGGTRAEAWTEKSALKKLKVYDKELKIYDKKTGEIQKDLLKIQEEWDKAVNQPDPGNKGYAKGYAAAEFDDSSWKTMKLPTYWEQAGLDIDGAVWFRKQVDIPADWAGKDLDLSLGAIDDYDTSYFNGTQVGSTGKGTPDWYRVLRNYRVPGKLVKAGKNTISVRVYDFFAEGGMYGPEPAMHVALAGNKNPGKIVLTGAWKYNVEFELDRVYLRIPNPSLYGQNMVCGLFNAMINPFVPFATKGVIWYQGESNASLDGHYYKLFPAMIESWRAAWQQEKLHFLFVQITNYMCVSDLPVENSGWVLVRDAQLNTLKVKDTAMAVTLDIGDTMEIHPKNKYDVGARLYLAAMGTVYGKNIVYSGPLYDSMKIEGVSVRIKFRHTGSGLMAKGGNLKGFAVAGKDKKWVHAKAEIDGDTVVVSSNETKNPVAVRYAWANNPVCNLYNKEGLPASPFRTDR